jgi:hypothetical protein
MKGTDRADGDVFRVYTCVSQAVYIHFNKGLPMATTLAGVGSGHARELSGYVSQKEKKLQYEGFPCGHPP